MNSFVTFIARLDFPSGLRGERASVVGRRERPVVRVDDSVYVRGVLSRKETVLVVKKQTAMLQLTK